MAEYRFGSIVVEAPRAGTCPVCAIEHPEEYPHNPCSLYYRMKFRQEHGRFPTWDDAMAHCPEPVCQKFIAYMRSRGILIGEASDTPEHPPE